MRLDGGYDMYGQFGERYLSTEPPLGRKVRYLNKNGWDYDKEYANKFFKEGQVLTVKEIYVSRSSSEVEFIEYPDHRFNTVMFEDME
jgi:hypothetical protein